MLYTKTYQIKNRTSEGNQRSAFFVALVVILCVNNILMLNGVTYAMDLIRMPIQVIMITFCAYQILLQKSSYPLTLFSLIVVIWTYSLYLLIQILLFSDNYMNDVSNSLFSFVCFILFYTSSQLQNDKYIKRILICAFVFFFLTFLYFRLFPPPTSLPLNNYHAQYVNSIYYVVCIMPFLLSFGEHSIIYFMICAVCVLASGKQGAFVGIIAAGITYYIVSMRIKGGSINFKSIIEISCLLGILAFVYSYLNETYSMDILEGFDSMQEDGGNGRMAIYSGILSLFSSSNPIEFLFGHGGPGAVARTLGISAHNDFLEILFDFGIIGLLLYASFVINLILIGNRLTRKRFYMAPAYMFSIVLFIVLSMISHIAFVLKYAMLLFAFWGFTLNQYIYYEKKNSSNSSR